MEPQHSHSRARPWIIAVASLNAVTALGGALGLATGFLALDAVTTSRLPWDSTVLGGVALALLVAVPNALLTLLAIRGDRRTGAVTIGVGALLVLWILVELAFIRELSFFHPLYAALGLLLVWLGGLEVRATTGIPGRTLWAEVRDVLLDLPVFLTTPLCRRWHLRWGATDAEVDADLPGDELVPGASYRSTRAITIQATPAQVWPWLVQAGCLRAGFYSDDLLDNLGHPSARTIRLQELQELEVGHVVPMSPSATVATSFRVASFDAPHELVWEKPDSSWAWRLTPTETGGTRLVTRVRAVHPWHRPLDGLLSLVLLELGDFAMMRRMLRGIRERAESDAVGQTGVAPEVPS